MKKIVCEMCESTEFIKVDGMFECQGCNCRYTLEEAKKLMVEMGDEPRNQPALQPQPEPEEAPEEVYPPHTPDSPNRIMAKVIKVGHETYTVESVMSLSALLGEPSSVFVYGPDQVGHIGAEVEVSNLAGKPIKYICLYLTPYNCVGDAVSCTVQGHSNFGINITGPIEVGQTWHGTCDGMWYNSDIAYAQITHAEVIFMDGSRERFDVEALTTMETSNPDLIPLTLYYDANAGSAQVLSYNLDNGERFMLNKGNSHLHYLKPGNHLLGIHNPLMKKNHYFTLSGGKTICVYGKSFSMDVSER